MNCSCYQTCEGNCTWIQLKQEKTEEVIKFHENQVRTHHHPYYMYTTSSLNVWQWAGAGNHGIGLRGMCYSFSGLSPWLLGYNVFSSSRDTDAVPQAVKHSCYLVFICTFPLQPWNQENLTGQQVLDINLASPVWLAKITVSQHLQLY